MNISISREKAGLTQAEFALRLGVTQGAVSQWEKEITHPRATLLPKIADVLGCTVDELLRKEGGGESGSAEEETV